MKVIAFIRKNYCNDCILDPNSGSNYLTVNILLLLLTGKSLCKNW